jgi:hypothetical protein
LLDHRQVEGFDGIMTGTPWAEPIAVRFEARFPLRFQGEGCQRLSGSVQEDRNAQWTKLAWFSRFGDEHASNRLRGNTVQ